MRIFLLCAALACVGLFITHANAGDDEASPVAKLQAQLAAHADRIAMLEKRIASLEERPGGSMSDEAFRAAMERVEKARTEERERERVEQEAKRTRDRLGDLDAKLDKETIEKLVKIQQDYRAKSRETMSELREAGGGMEEFRTAMQTLREDLRTSVEELVSADHVDSVVRIVGGRGGGRMGGGGRGFGR